MRRTRCKGYGQRRKSEVFSGASGLQYAAAAKHAGEDGIRTLRLLYKAETLPAVCDAAFYCDRLPFDAAPAESAAVNVSLIGRGESEAAQ